MWFQKHLPTLLPILALLPTALSVADGPLSTSGRWIVDSAGQRFKLRCVNWAGHGETNIPEGLSKQPGANIASWISTQGFNCVRLTYSIDMALNPNQSVSDSFSHAAAPTNADPVALQAQYTAAVNLNPSLATASTLSTYSTVIEALAAQGIKVILDNHVSRASWCCNNTDGNGWWDTAAGYTDENSRYFNTTNWLSGLSAMSTFTHQHANIIGMSLRNELRADPSQDGNDHADWYSLVTQGAMSIHAANPDLLIMIGGVSSATDSSFLRDQPLDTSAWQGKTVWEFHSYYWSYLPEWADICSLYTAIVGGKAGFLLEQNQAFTGPLWLSEFGAEQVLTSDGGLGGITQAIEQNYLKCLVGYMEGNDADWALWAVQGSYYVREGTVDYDEGYGLLDHEWKDWRNGTFKEALGGMFEMTQGPGA